MDAFLDMLEKEIARLKDTIRELETDRMDEANLARVRMNIFDVCRTVHGALLRKHSPAEFEAVYLAKLEDFRSAWTKSQEAAQTHGDVEKAVIEQVKIEALSAIRAEFVQVRHA